MKTCCTGFGEHRFKDAPTIPFLKRLGIKEPYNAVTAPFISLCGYNCVAKTRELEFVRWFIIINGLSSCFMHSLLPQQSSPWALFLARLDCTSMLAAIYGGLSALWPETLPIEFSLILLILPAIVFDEIQGPRWFPAAFGVGWASLAVALYLMLPADRHPALAWNVFWSAFASACQIADQQKPGKGGLGWIRRNIPLHAIWHITAGIMVTRLVELAGGVL